MHQYNYLIISYIIEYNRRWSLRRLPLVMSAPLLMEANKAAAPASPPSPPPPEDPLTSMEGGGPGGGGGGHPPAGALGAAAEAEAMGP